MLDLILAAALAAPSPSASPVPAASCTQGDAAVHRHAVHSARRETKVSRHDFAGRFRGRRLDGARGGTVRRARLRDGIGRVLRGAGIAENAGRRSGRNGRRSRSRHSQSVTTSMRHASELWAVRKAANSRCLPLRPIRESKPWLRSSIPHRLYGLGRQRCADRLFVERGR